VHTWLINQIVKLLQQWLPVQLAPQRKVVAAAAAAPAVPLLVSLLKLIFPVMPRWLDLALGLLGGAAPTAAAYAAQSKPLGTAPGTTRVT
jgi:hypothetical protein